jgi:hypothetical protein
MLTNIRDTIQDLPDAHAYLLGFQTTNPFDPTTTSRTTDPNRLPFGLDALYDDWDLGVRGARTVPGITGILKNWAQAWADTRGETTPEGTIYAYLDSRLIWAINNPHTSGHHDFQTELKILHHTVTRLAGTLPEPTGSDCLTCNGPLARQWGPDGLDDHATCQRCGRQYTYADHQFAIRQKLTTAPTEHPNALVTEPQARRIYPQLAPGTIRTWIARDKADQHTWQTQMTAWTRKRRQLLQQGEDPADAGPQPQPPTPRLPTAGRNHHGQPLYRLADITTRANRTTIADTLNDAHKHTTPPQTGNGVA